MQLPSTSSSPAVAKRHPRGCFPGTINISSLPYRTMPWRNFLADAKPTSGFSPNVRTAENEGELFRRSFRDRRSRDGNNFAWGGVKRMQKQSVGNFSADEKFLPRKLRHGFCQSSSYSRRPFVHAYRPGCGYKLGFMREIKCALLSKRRRLYRDRGPRYSSGMYGCVDPYRRFPVYVYHVRVCTRRWKAFTLEYVVYDEPFVIRIDWLSSSENE